MKSLLALLFIATLPVVALAEPVPSESSAPLATTARTVSPDEAEALMKSSPKLTILDVRTPDEFAEGHIPGARNIDFFGDDFATRVAALDPATPLLLHCASGSRSSRAVEKITALKKFHVIYHLKAGFNGWTTAHKPVERKPAGEK